MDTIADIVSVSPMHLYSQIRSTVQMGLSVLTDVVRTPQSSDFSNWGVGALGVSINSNSLSEPFVLWVFDAILSQTLN